MSRPDTTEANIMGKQKTLLFLFGQWPQRSMSYALFRNGIKMSKNIAPFNIGLN